MTSREGCDEDQHIEDVWPPDPECTCRDYDEYPVCDIHVWIDPVPFRV